MLLKNLADKMILIPSTAPIDGIRAARMEIAGPNGALEIWTMKSPGAIDRDPAAIVLAFIGNAARAEYDAEDLAEWWGLLPVEVWAVNYPGYGRSAGKATLDAIAPAALAAFDAAAAQADARPVIVSGRSIGSTAALHVAANRPAAGVVLHSPVPLRRLIVGRFGWWNLWLGAMAIAACVPVELDSIRNAGRVKAKGVFLFTGADTMIPPAYQQRIIGAYAGDKRVVTLGIDHNDPLPEEAMGEVQEALGWLLKGGGNDAGH